MKSVSLLLRLGGCGLLVLFLTLRSNAQTTNPENTDDEVISLDAFVVNTENDVGYVSKNSLSGNLTNLELVDIPANISVMNQELLDDLGVESALDAMEFATGVAVTYNGGIRGGTGNSFNFRGIETNWQARDNFRWYVPNDLYNIERLEINLGPVGILYGESAVTGSLNSVTKRPKLSGNFLNTRVQLDSEGSVRATLDWNHQLNDSLALRLNTLASRTEFWREPAKDDRDGITLSAFWQPADSTRVTVSFERGSLERIPLVGLNIDEYSQYTLGSASVDPSASVPGTSNLSGSVHVLNGDILNFSGVPDTQFRITNNGGPATLVPFNITPPEVIASGPLFRTDNDFWVGQLHWDQRVSDNLLFQASMNVQQQEPTDSLGNVNVYRDVNPVIPSPANDGTTVANPNFEELMIWQRPSISDRSNEQEQYRFQALYAFDQFDHFKQDVNLGYYARRDAFNLADRRYTLDPDYAESIGRPRNVASNEVWIQQPLNNLTGVPDNPQIMPYTMSGGATQYVDIALDSFYANAFGRYWDDRITTMIGFRYDDYSRTRYNFTSQAEGDAVLIKSEENISSAGTASSTKSLVNYGFTFDVTDWASLYYNYGESFQFSGTYIRIDGSDGGPREGEGDDMGVRFRFMDDQVNLNVTYYENDYKNIRWARPPNNVINELNTILTPSTPFIRQRVSRDETSEGWEFEFTAQPTKNLSLRFSYSMYDLEMSGRAPLLNQLYQDVQDTGADPASYQNLTDYVLLLNDQLIAADDTRFNWAARYQFTEGDLAGFFFGMAGYWRDEVPLLTPVLPAYPDGFTQESYIWVNGFIGYRTKMFNDADATFRINAENLTGVDEIVGAPGSQNIIDDRLWTFSFDLAF